MTNQYLDYFYEVKQASNQEMVAVTDVHTQPDLSEELVRIGAEQAALRRRDLGFKDDALAGADQDGSRVGLVAQQLVPAHALDEVAPPAGQAAHFLRVSVKVQTLAGGQADEQMRACMGRERERHDGRHCFCCCYESRREFLPEHRVRKKT